MKKVFGLFWFFLLLLSNNDYAQSNENWVPVYSDKEKIMYINVNGLSAYQEDQIFVWVLEEMTKPFSMEEISGSISKVRSYYMISKEMQRYSLCDVIYYDDNNNVLKTYHYDRNYERPEFKYSSPILKNSEIENVYLKCLEVINSSNQ